MAVSDRGFASMSPERRKEIASMGGKASHRGGFSNKKTAVEAGRKGGTLSRRGATEDMVNEPTQIDQA